MTLTSQRQGRRRCRWPATVFALALAVAVVMAPPAGAAAPNDPLLLAQWSLVAPHGINAEPAWALGTRTKVTVAVLDTGIDARQRDLVRSLWTNRGEIPGNGLDDDRNGYVDDVHGYDFVSGTGRPVDDNGHGTAMASLIAAPGGDDLGMAGVAWNARIMALKVIDATGSPSDAALAQAIRYAVANRAQVINLSLGEPAASGVVEDAIQAANSAGVLIVAAAGNSGTNIDAAPAYPASYSEPNVLTVASSSPDGALSSFSNRGPATVELSAPGDHVVAALPGGDYAQWSGTSAAAAEVSGALALLAGAQPEAGAAQLKNAVLAGARKGVAGVAAGALDVFGAMLHLGPPRPRTRRA